jgi:mono/diheme cytochrome c family protein/glucose/arabinose dehydrogenase
VRRSLAAALLVGLGAWARAQNGDVKDEAQPPLPEAWRKPPPALLSPDEARAAFVVDAGLRVELVAAEPLVRSPVCAAFDERGRLYVCEMTSYMRDVDGRDEARADGVVALLEDVDGDGRMDRRSEFLAGLVLPRAVAPTRGGVLVIAPPELLFASDSDGDGRADEVRVLERGLQGIASPEHAINGLHYALDNWFWCANAPVRYRWNGEQLERGRTAGGGQWGLSEDARGRLYFNDNSNPLRCDLYPSHWAVRNASLGVAPGMNVSIAKGARPRPPHTTPGVNRGYRAGLLVDARLNEFTGACAPLVYEGDALPQRYRGSAFVAEPCGNLVHRFELESDAKGRPVANTAAPDGAFLSSPDERFRPVHLFEGPDGALYVADMARGVIQHRLFVTSWLRAQVEERKLEAPTDRGRIWRVTSGERKARTAPLADASWTELGEALDAPNRWTRKTAQRLFVEGAALAPGVIERAAFDVLREQARGASTELGRLHALWALDGLGHAEPDLARRLWWSERGSDPLNGARLMERVLREGGTERVEWWMTRARFAPAEQKRAALLALGSSPGGVTALHASFEFLEAFADDDVRRGQLLSSLGGGELELVAALLARDPGERDERALLTAAAGCVVREARAQRIAALLELTAKFATARDAEALARGVLDACPKRADGSRRALVLEGEPREFTRVAAAADAPASVRELLPLLVWPGKPGAEAALPRELTSSERALAERGRALYEQTCASCHQLSGRGDPGLAPPLRDSPWVLGDPDVFVRVVLHGLRGPLTFGDTTWDGEMPAHELSDEELAGLGTYLRREWGHDAATLTPEFVRDVRARHAQRRSAWSVQELRSTK